MGCAMVLILHTPKLKEQKKAKLQINKELVMSAIKSLLVGAIGYGISEVSKSHPVRDAINNRYDKKVSLEDLIDEYARRYEIYTTKNEFAHHLHQIAKKYEEYNYDEVYGERGW